MIAPSPVTAAVLDRRATVPHGDRVLGRIHGIVPPGTDVGQLQVGPLLRESIDTETCPVLTVKTAPGFPAVFDCPNEIAIRTVSHKVATAEHLCGVDTRHGAGTAVGPRRPLDRARSRPDP